MLSKNRITRPLYNTTHRLPRISNGPPTPTTPYNISTPFNGSTEYQPFGQTKATPSSFQYGNCGQFDESIGCNSSCGCISSTDSLPLYNFAHNAGGYTTPGSKTNYQPYTYGTQHNQQCGKELLSISQTSEVAATIQPMSTNIDELNETVIEATSNQVNSLLIILISIL